MQSRQVQFVWFILQQKTFDNKETKDNFKRSNQTLPETKADVFAEYEREENEEGIKRRIDTSHQGTSGFTLNMTLRFDWCSSETHTTHAFIFLMLFHLSLSLCDQFSGFFSLVNLFIFKCPHHCHFKCF